MTFQKGVSGNPKGKPNGTKHWRTKVREQLETAAPDIIADLIARAPKNLKVALFITDKVLPPASNRAVPILPAIILTGSPGDKADQVADALAGGKLTIEEAGAMLDALATAANIRQASDTATRLTAVEKLLADLTGTPHAAE